MTKLWASKYTGGKSAGNPYQIGGWIASLLPHDRLYAEPFAGMLGVLLRRPPSHFELISDADDTVIAFWRAVRNSPDEFAYKLDNLPSSQTEHEWAHATAHDQEQDDVSRALAFVIIQYQAVMPGSKQWLPRFTSRDGSDWRHGLQDRIHALCDRIRNVQIANEDAVRFLQRLAPRENAVIYCDPPYGGMASAYNVDVDRDALRDALLEQQGRVLISGYGDEWDHLGWERHEYTTHTLKASLAAKGDGAIQRTEVAWSNYHAEQKGQTALL